MPSPWKRSKQDDRKAKEKPNTGDTGMLYIERKSAETQISSMSSEFMEHEEKNEREDLSELRQKKESLKIFMQMLKMREQ